MSFVSYAQNFEDVMLRRALKDVRAGFYIDVGAQDPVVDSVTRAFYELGWRGINVEPVQAWHDKLVADRPGDLNLRLALGAGEGEMTLYEIPDTGLSTTDAGFAAKHAREGREAIASRVRATTLDAVCREHGVDTVHFLKIDVEGAERIVLEGFSFAVRPWIVLVEATLPNSQEPAYAEWEHLLTGRGYRLVYQDGLNRFYLDDAHAELAAAFATPPNVFDHFVRYPEWRAQVELHQAREAHRQLAATQHLVEARERAAAAEAARDAALVSATDLRHSVAAWTELVNERDARLQRMDADFRAGVAALEQRLRAEQAAREQDIAALQQQLRATLDARDQGVLDIERLRVESERIPALEAERARLGAERDALGAQLAQRECELAALRQALHDIHASHSWRVTRPLRDVRRWLAGVVADARRQAVRTLRGPLTLAASWAPARAVGRRLFARNPQLTDRLLRLGGRLPAVPEPPVATAASPEVVLTPRAQAILRAMQDVVGRNDPQAREG